MGAPQSAGAGGAPGHESNREAVRRAALDPANAAWLEEVAGLVDSRLDAVRDDWRELPDAAVLPPAAFGLLLGVLARQHPHAREALSRAAEAHPSYDAFPPTARLPALERLSTSESLALEWIGAALGVDEAARLRPLCAHGAEEAAGR